MHVALLAPVWPPGSYPSGIATYVGSMRAGLVAAGHRVSIFSGGVAPGCSDPDVHSIVPGAARRVLRSLADRAAGRRASAFDLGRTIAEAVNRVHSRNPIDVIEMEESFGWAADVGRLSPVPVVCKLHGPAFVTLVAEELQSSFGQEKVRREGEALARLPVLISPSQCTLDETIGHYGLRPAHARHIVNPLSSAPGMRLWEAAGADPDTILFVGRFDKVKGADLLILAFQRLLAKRPGLRLLFVGPDSGIVAADGSLTHLREFVASLADERLSEAISHLGRLDSAEVAELRPRAAVTVIASRRESQGYTALEAMLQGCPTVCTDTSGLSEIVVHGVTGLKARSEDPEDLAAQVRRLLDDPGLARALAPAGRRYVLEQHAPAKVVAETVDAYRVAIDLHRRRPAGSTRGT
jgi:glycosyltransferase involved in cell wall biosynthesis